MDKRTYIDPQKSTPIQTCTVLSPSAYLYREASGHAPVETELVRGERFIVHSMNDGWAWGQAVSPVPMSPYPGYVGYIQLSDVTDTAGQPSHIVTALMAPVFRAADIKSGVVETLPMNARISGTHEGDFVRTVHGFVHVRHVRDVQSEAELKDFVAIAEQYMGVPYVWGGTTSDGIDCSGLVRASLRAAGQDAPRDADQQMQLGEAVPIKLGYVGLERGDLVFWKGHVGIMQSPTRLLHANAHHMAVAVEPLSEAVKRIEAQMGPVLSIHRL